MFSVSRRGFLRTSGQGLIAAAGILGRPPASWAVRQLGVLTAVNQAAAADAKLSELAKRFSKATGVTVRSNKIQGGHMPAKLSAEIMARSGHDIISLEMHDPWLFQPSLLDVSDVCADLEDKHGEWFPFLQAHARVKGRWLGVPYLFSSFAGSHRLDLFEAVGEQAPDTWNDLLRAGRKLKTLGHPVGFAIGQTTDSVTSLYSILWCFGAKDVAEDGRTVTINSRETEASLEYVRTLYSDAMDPAVLSWGNAGNTMFLSAGKGSWIHNSISHYVAAKQKRLPVADVTGFHPSPAGPGGRHTIGVPSSLGIWTFSKNAALAKEFLRWFFEPAQYHEWIMAGDNSNHPVWRDMENHPVWDVDPKYRALKGVAHYSHLYGWPAPPDERIRLVTNSYIIPSMVARVVTNVAKPKEAMVWAETAIERLVTR
jgi:multiple sugar transport system substrate-binding protein